MKATTASIVPTEERDAIPLRTCEESVPSALRGSFYEG